MSYFCNFFLTSLREKLTQRQPRCVLFSALSHRCFSSSSTRHKNASKITLNVDTLSILRCCSIWHPIGLLPWGCKRFVWFFFGLPRDPAGSRVAQLFGKTLEPFLAFLVGNVCLVYCDSLSLDDTGHSAAYPLSSLALPLHLFPGCSMVLSADSCLYERLFTTCVSIRSCASANPQIN